MLHARVRAPRRSPRMVRPPGRKIKTKRAGDSTLMSCWTDPAVRSFQLRRRPRDRGRGPLGKRIAAVPGSEPRFRDSRTPDPCPRRRSRRRRWRPWESGRRRTGSCPPVRAPARASRTRRRQSRGSAPFWSTNPTSLPQAAAIRNAMRIWLAVRKAVSEANSPKAQGSSTRLGTTSGRAVATAKSAFSRATAWMARSTTGARNGGNWRASGRARSSLPRRISATVADGFVAPVGVGALAGLRCLARRGPGPPRPGTPGSPARCTWSAR